MTYKKRICSLSAFSRLLQIVQNDGYALYGPKVHNEVIVYDRLFSEQDLPIGIEDEQRPGYYRLKKRSDKAYFGYNLGPHSWKKYLFPPKEQLFSAHKQANGLVVLQETQPKIQKMAFLGVRACEIRAIQIQDTVFSNKIAEYTQYKERRDNLLILSVNCTRSVSTCFCTSMECGPKATQGFDLSLTEVIDPKEHYFIIEIGSEKGASVIDTLRLPEAPDLEANIAEALIEKNSMEMDKKVDTHKLPEMLSKSFGCNRWNDVAQRCINCANCTMVCPTCFCSSTEDKVSLDGEHSQRWQSWDSCFNLSHSHVHGGNIRESAKSRYRQWLTHKFGTWWAQFGSSGCVGCGRCMTWCPVGIDVTEEIKELQKESHENDH